MRIQRHIQDCEQIGQSNLTFLLSVFSNPIPFLHFIQIHHLSPMFNHTSKFSHTSRHVNPIFFQTPKHTQYLTHKLKFITKKNYLCLSVCLSCSVSPSQSLNSHSVPRCQTIFVSPSTCVCPSLSLCLYVTFSLSV